MENTIKQSENERERGLETIRRMHEEFKVLREDTDQLCGFLGLERTPELDIKGNITE